MTVIEGVEIDNIYIYEKNHIKEALLNNDPIESKLNVIMVISNPCLYKKRYILARDFIKKMLNENNVELYIVELCYKNQKFIVTEKHNKNHLQIRTETPLWHKENMINIGVKKLLPINWKAFAWIDADIEFENTDWALDTLKILNGSKDIIQLFSHCLDMNHDMSTMNVFNSAGYQYEKGYKYNNKGLNYWHPGYAWACTRKAYEKMGGLYEHGILGSGDNLMLFSILQNGVVSLNKTNNKNYIQSVIDFQNKIKFIRFGYIPGVIRHYFHGTKKNRNYTERWSILINHDYDPYKHITYDENGILVPTNDCPNGLLEDIYNYFLERNEDDFLVI